MNFESEIPSSGEQIDRIQTEPPERKLYVFAACPASRGVHFCIANRPGSTETFRVPGIPGVEVGMERVGVEETCLPRLKFPPKNRHAGRAALRSDFVNLACVGKVLPQAVVPLRLKSRFSAFFSGEVCR